MKTRLRFAACLAAILSLAGPARAQGLSWEPTPLAMGAPPAAGCIVPLYSYPLAWNNGVLGLSPEWRRLIEAKRARPTAWIIAIVNPKNGPATNPTDDANYRIGLRALRASSIGTLGYVYTRYAGQSGDRSRTLAVVKAQILAWRQLYGADAPDGIFIDEMATANGPSPDPGVTRAQYYAELSHYAKSLGAGLVVGNPGTETTLAFVPTVDVIVLYESAGFPSLAQLAGWHTIVPPWKWAVLGYSNPSPPSVSRLRASRAFAGWFYTTPDGGSNPWDTVPSAPYLDALLAGLIAP